MADGKVAEIINELIDPAGTAPTITANILRYWSREKITVFAKHLLGDQCQKCIREESTGKDADK